MSDLDRARPDGPGSQASPSAAVPASSPVGADPSRGQRYRHVKRGTTYEIVGVAELQMNCDLLVDGSAMVVYRGEDGKLWAREESEFMDGRFSRVSDAPEHPEDLRPWGWAPGSYVFKCVDCPKDLDIYEKMGRLGDKRSFRCRDHALSARDSDEHRNGEDAQRLSGEAMPARAEGIAQAPAGDS